MLFLVFCPVKSALDLTFWVHEEPRNYGQRQQVMRLLAAVIGVFRYEILHLPHISSSVLIIPRFLLFE